MTERKLNYAQAVNEALREEMRRDPSIFLIGEDIRQSVFGDTAGLWKEFGDLRVINAPISESAIIGGSLGAAITGMRPVVHMMFSDFLPVALDQVYNQTAKIRYMTGGKIRAPVVFRAPSGGGLSAAAQHSSSIYSWFVNMPGLFVALPSTPYDVKGLLKTALRGDDPVVVFELKNALTDINHFENWAIIPDQEYVIPFGVADVKKVGENVTIVATLAMVMLALNAARKLEKEGVSAEVIDLRTLVPFDKRTVLESVKRTGRLVIVDEAPRTGGAAAEISARIMEEAFEYLRAPIERVTSIDAPVPFSPPMEKFAMPDENKVVNAVKKVMRYSASSVRATANPS